jgi:ElaB/YqjD/DUF883 family membrane-anchored ribosome-binding protein
MTSQPISVGEKIINPVKSSAESMLDRGSEKLAETRGRVSDLLDRTKDRASEMQDQFEGYVQERPLKSVLIAAGVGAAVGVLVGVLAARR